MNQKRFGELIKKIRKDNNLTQKDLANKYNVTYQAVSKWENGNNMPDISLIKQISNDYNISLDDILDGKYKRNNLRNTLLIILIILMLILIFVFIITRNNSFKFKTISTSCSDFSITGSMSYNNNKSAIYISNISYCGGDDTEEYSNIKCTLIEKNGENEKVISTYNNSESSTLEEFLKKVTFSVDNHDNECKEYRENNLILEIIATKNDNKTVLYKIPLSLKDVCSE